MRIDKSTRRKFRISLFSWVERNLLGITPKPETLRETIDGFRERERERKRGREEGRKDTDDILENNIIWYIPNRFTIIDTYKPEKNGQRVGTDNSQKEKSMKKYNLSTHEIAFNLATNE